MNLCFSNDPEGSFKSSGIFFLRSLRIRGDSKKLCLSDSFEFLLQDPSKISIGILTSLIFFRKLEELS